MKILKKGSDWSIEKKCSECDSLLLIERRDLFFTGHESPRGERRSHITFKCAVCNVRTKLLSLEVPSYFKIPDQSVWNNTSEEYNDQS